MDIFYSTGFKRHLLKSYKESDGEVHGGWRIWAWRLVQTLLDLIATFFVCSAMLHVTWCRKDEKVKADKKRWDAHLMKEVVWLTIMAFATLLSLSGLLLYVYGKHMKSRYSWVITTGIYNLVLSHVIFFAMVLASHHFLIYSAPKKCLWTTFLGALISTLASIGHFLSVFFPTPHPLLLRLQKGAVAPAKSMDDGKKMSKDDKALTDKDAESATTTLASQSESADPTPGQTPNPGVNMT